MRAEVAEEVRRQIEEREGGDVEQDIEEMLQATNARRAARGLPPLTREDVERDVMGA